jgi:hypothetical protein
VNPRSLAPGAFEGLKLMCQEFGGFEAKVLESAAASTVALGTDWRPVRDGTAIAVMAETTARAVHAEGIAVVPVRPPPQYVPALTWRHDEHPAAAHRFLAYLRRYRDQHACITHPGVAPLTTITTQALSPGATGAVMRCPHKDDIKQRESLPQNSACSSSDPSPRRHTSQLPVGARRHHPVPDAARHITE